MKDHNLVSDYSNLKEVYKRISSKKTKNKINLILKDLRDALFESEEELDSILFKPVIEVTNKDLINIIYYFLYVKDDRSWFKLGHVQTNSLYISCHGNHNLGSHSINLLESKITHNPKTHVEGYSTDPDDIHAWKYDEAELTNSQRLLTVKTILNLYKYSKLNDHLYSEVFTFHENWFCKHDDFWNSLLKWYIKHHLDKVKKINWDLSEIKQENINLMNSELGIEKFVL